MSVMLSILSPSFGNLDTIRQHIHWFASLGLPELELIIVDQNDGGCSFTVAPGVTYVHSDVKGLSVNRNIGLGYCSGEYVMFLDDDARFDAVMGARILNWVSSRSYDIFLCAIVDENDNLTSYTPYSEKRELDYFTLEGRVNSNGLIVRKSQLESIRFDEKMGVGALYGSCEELDLVFRLMLKNCTAIYGPQNRVVHPVKEYSEEKCFSYGTGHGFLTHKLFFEYRSPPCYFIGVRKILAAFAKFLVSFVCFGVARRNYRCWVRGFVSGFILRGGV